MLRGMQQLVRYTRVQEIVGDVIRLNATGVRLGDMAEVENTDGESSLARVIGLDRDLVSLQVFAGGKGLSTDAVVQFLGKPLDVVCSDNVLGRIFRGSGEPLDGGPDLATDRRVPVGGPTVNPVMRFYSGAVETQKKQAMAFELSPFDQKLLKFGTLFRERFMDIRVSLGVLEALDLCWQTLAECFEPQELLMKQNLVEKYFPKK